MWPGKHFRTTCYNRRSLCRLGIGWMLPTSITQPPSYRLMDFPPRPKTTKRIKTLPESRDTRKDTVGVILKSNAFKIDV